MRLVNPDFHGHSNLPPEPNYDHGIILVAPNSFALHSSNLPSLAVISEHLYRYLSHYLAYGQIFPCFLQDFVKSVAPTAPLCGPQIFASHNPFTLVII